MSNLTINVQSFTDEQIDLIKTSICKGASNDELKYFLYVANKTGLDPMTRQIYSVSRYDAKSKREVRTIQTGIDGFRVVAERSGNYAGQLGPFWCGGDGIWKDVWTLTELPFACKVGVLRKDFEEPLWAVANFDSYKQEFKDKDTGKMKLGKFWAQMPELMIAKVAEALALRKAFPQDLSGVYSSDEMAQASNDELIEEKKPSDFDAKKELLKKIKDLSSTLAGSFELAEKIAFRNNVLGVKNFTDLERKSVQQLADLELKLGKML